MSRYLTMRSLRDFLRDDGGATAIEYALIACGIAGVIIAVVVSLGTSVSTMYSTVATDLN